MMTLIPPQHRGTFFAKHNFDDLLRGDLPSRMAAYATARQNGILNANEIRAKEDMNGYKDGDLYMVNGAMVPVNEAKEDNVL